MARTITRALRRQLDLQASGEAIIAMLTITHADLATPIRVAGDGAGYVFQGETYVGFPFKFALLTDEEAAPRCQIEVQNVDRKIGDALRALTSPARLRLDLVAASEFDQTVDPRLPLATTNLLLRSEDMAAAPWNSAAAVSANTVAAPDGTITADTLTLSGSAVPYHYQIVTVTPSTTYTFSAWVRLGALAASDFRLAFRNDTAGTFMVTDVMPAATPTATGWTRIAYTLTTPAGCTALRVYPFRHSGSPSGTFHLWGAQLAPGAAAGGYVRTADAVAQSATPVEYSANHLFLVNVSVDAMTVTGDVVSWDYTQDT